MSIEENKAIVRGFFEELLSTDNFSVADEILAPDFRFYFAGSPEPKGTRSRPGLPCAALTRASWEGWHRPAGR